MQDDYIPRAGCFCNMLFLFSYSMFSLCKNNERRNAILLQFEAHNLLAIPKDTCLSNSSQCRHSHVVLKEFYIKLSGLKVRPAFQRNV